MCINIMLVGVYKSQVKRKILKIHLIEYNLMWWNIIVFITQKLCIFENVVLSMCPPLSFAVTYITTMHSFILLQLHSIWGQFPLDFSLAHLQVTRMELTLWEAQTAIVDISMGLQFEWSAKSPDWCLLNISIHTHGIYCRLPLNQRFVILS